jgi:bacillopeptidase F
MMNATARNLMLILTGTFLLTSPMAEASWMGAASSWDDLLRVRSSEDRVPVIVRFRKAGAAQRYPRQTELKAWRTSQIEELKARSILTHTRWKDRLSSSGARQVRRLWAIHGLAMEAPPPLIRELLDDPEVESVRPDETVPLLTDPLAHASEDRAGWNLRMVRATELWALGHRGQGVVVATLDSGVDLRHAALQSRWRGGVNSWFDPSGQHAQPYDSSGHGTWTMGILVGGDAGGEPMGIAPDARWISVKIFNDSGLSSFSIIHEAFQWILDPDGDPLTDDAPSVVVCPWDLSGTPDQCIPEFDDDIQALTDADVAVVFPAGNGGPGLWTSSPPANSPRVLAVGAVDAAMRIASFSSRGPSACGGGLYPQLVAPGVAVRTSDLTAGGLFPAATTTVSGTSFAAPHVGGALALLRGLSPSSTVEELQAALLRSAADGGITGTDFSFGYGVVDVMAAHGELLAGFSCTDSDRDGYFAEPGCGTRVDCRDTDGSVHPGAGEVARDGLDQDCNGFDVSIRVRRAVHNVKNGTLSIRLTSDLRQSARLALAELGPMSYIRGKMWGLFLSSVPGVPGMLTVTGREGDLAIPVRVIPRR